MGKILLIFLTILLSVSLLLSYKYFSDKNNSMSGAPPYGESEEEAPNMGKFSWLATWKRPDGPAKVILQVGHWKNDELPEELINLRESSGSSGGGKSEWEVNYGVAQETAKLLGEKGINVELLPATIPPSSWADVFVAIHADGSTDRTKGGFKIASSWRDLTGKADKLVSIIEDSYKKETGMSIDENITRNMRGYYAFSWWRYEHTVHPMTVSSIIETGFLTNSSDRKMLINSPETPAKGIAEGILTYLTDEGLVKEN